MLENVKNTLLYLGLGTLFTHEMDAMLNHEWVVLPLTSWLENETGMLVFLYAHIPLFALVIAFVASLNPKRRKISRIVMAVFLIVHSVLHFLFSRFSTVYEFSSITSSLFIYGAAILGAAYLFLEFSSKNKNAVIK